MRRGTSCYPSSPIRTTENCSSAAARAAWSGSGFGWGTDSMTALRALTLACLAAGLSLACDNAGESLSHGVGAINVINAGAFFDRDGSGTFNAPDTLFAGVKVNLFLQAERFRSQ